MARIPGLPARGAGPFVKLVYRSMQRRYGASIDPVTITAHHKRILFGYLMLEWAFGGSKSVEPRLTALAELKGATLIGCEFCVDFGSYIGRKESGITDEQLLDLARYQESPHFNEVEKLVLDLTVAMTQTPVAVSDELFARLQEHFDERQLVELCTAAAIENFRSRFNGAFGIGSQHFTEGTVCALPEPGVASAVG